MCLARRHFPILDLDSTYEATLENENKREVSAYLWNIQSVLYSQAISILPNLITPHAHGVYMWASLFVDKVFGAQARRIMSGEGSKKKFTLHLWTYLVNIWFFGIRVYQNLGARQTKAVRDICAT